MAKLMCRDPDCQDPGCVTECDCGRGTYPACSYSSCYDCFLDRRADYVNCIYCDRWHSPEFDTCFKCRPRGRDEAASELKRIVLTRDMFRCSYCGIEEGTLQVDLRLIRPKCPPFCATEHNHRRPCEPGCNRRHKHRREDDPDTCRPGCVKEHGHLVKDDDGERAARLHVDHIQPCSKGGTPDPWNLQTLCGVCNITKGNDWWRGSRHHVRRRLVMAAYLTYLHGFLTPEQRGDLACAAALDELTPAQALRLISDDYIGRVKALRPRPQANFVGPQVEEVPEAWAHFDLIPFGEGDA